MSEYMETDSNKQRVIHPKYYQHPSGVECIDIIRHHDCNIANAIKYLFRCGLKREAGLTDKEKAVEDLNKAIFYIKDEIENIYHGECQYKEK